LPFEGHLPLKDQYCIVVLILLFEKLNHSKNVSGSVNFLHQQTHIIAAIYNQKPVLPAPQMGPFPRLNKTANTSSVHIPSRSGIQRVPCGRMSDDINIFSKVVILVSQFLLQHVVATVRPLLYALITLLYSTWRRLWLTRRLYPTQSGTPC